MLDLPNLIGGGLLGAGLGALPTWYFAKRYYDKAKVDALEALKAVPNQPCIRVVMAEKKVQSGVTESNPKTFRVFIHLEETANCWIECFVEQKAKSNIYFPLSLKGETRTFSPLEVSRKYSLGELKPYNPPDQESLISIKFFYRRKDTDTSFRQLTLFHGTNKDFLESVERVDANTGGTPTREMLESHGVYNRQFFTSFRERDAKKR